jgi:5-oxopent-3-ene-1,2,5-tricarboxylate decarboxylase/2-hydroxyhepta-2,4-diene-1,7-dioate isomerase
VKRARIEHRGLPADAIVAEDGTVLIADGGRLPPEEVVWRAPTEGAVVCVALNYAGHYAEHETAFHRAPYQAPPRTPVYFIKPANTLAGHRAPVPCPADADAIQPGPALAAVIGRRARRVRAAAAFDHIAGYTVFNDFSAPETSYFRPPVREKCRDGFGPLGPCIVDAADVGDPGALAVRTFVNGALRQEGNTRDLIYRIPALLEHLSGFMTLAPGDVIVTGFPPGRVGVAAGDLVEVEVEGVGRLANPIVTEAEYYAARARR